MVALSDNLVREWSYFGHILVGTVFEIVLWRIMIAASALMVTSAYGLVKRISVLIHIVGEASWPSAFEAGMTAAAVLVFFQLIHHVTFLYSLLNFVVLVSHFYTPCQVGWL